MQAALKQPLPRSATSRPIDLVHLASQTMGDRALETEILLEGLRADRAKFAKQPDAARKLLAFGDSKPDAKLDAVELAAHAVTANVLLNLDEAVVRP